MILELILYACQGTDRKLTAAWNTFHSKNTLREPGEKEEVINESVRSLINQSMQNYYFERIGDTILEARREKSTFRDIATERRDRRKVKLKQLVKAYNVYADQEVTIDEIIPSELKLYF